MSSVAPELFAESLQLVAYTVVAGILTAGGVAAEYASAQHLGGGESMVGLWLAAIGCVMLYAGVYGLGYQKVLPQVN
ncbi:hypothetical protein [Halopiger djelfimassiliensis]|uniref:hypothetical protein n=1 Tax=Halopiger djelfimassiliensis TaxID=1293047 RepID=UPI0006781BFA|nr:hypothetical protein [Halopiger djelfimassiliensis]